MRILAVIPHYFRASGDRRHGSTGGARQARLRALSSCVAALHQLFGRPQCVIDIVRRTTEPANALTAEGIDALRATGVPLVAENQHAVDENDYLYEVDFE